MTTDCQCLLAGYFLHRRNSNQISDAHFQLPEVGSMNLLLRLASSHAKV